MCQQRAHSQNRDPNLNPGPSAGKEVGCADRDRICNKPIDYDTVLIHLVPEYFPRWMELEAGKRIIGYATWETDTIPSHWPAILNKLDRVWVPSTWNRHVFEHSGLTVPIDVIPHILGPAPACNAKVAHPLTSRISSDHFVFYSVNVWSRRKALWLLVEAFWSTFSAHEPVTLVLKTSRDDSNSRFCGQRFPLRLLARTAIAYRKLAEKFRERPATVLIAEENTPQPMVDHLHDRGDCYVSLSRSEGWGLGAFDAVAAGNPVIMTGYGGQTDFLSSEHAYLVDYTLVPVEDALNRKSYSLDHHWAEPDIQHAGRLMREVFEDREVAATKGQVLKSYAQRHYSTAARHQSIRFFGHGNSVIQSQPLGNEDGSIQVVFNGAIYNHLELRRELEADLRSWRSCILDSLAPRDRRAALAGDGRGAPGFGRRSRRSVNGGYVGSR